MTQGMQKKTLTGIIIDEHTELTLNELSRACSSSAEWIIELVDQGALEPVSYSHTQWRFSGRSLQRARTAMRLQRDLGINLAGVALAIDLLDEIEELRARLCRLERRENF
jgi:chaperone modulatory protein CbpM